MLELHTANAAFLTLIDENKGLISRDRGSLHEFNYLSIRLRQSNDANRALRLKLNNLPNSLPAYHRELPGVESQDRLSNLENQDENDDPVPMQLNEVISEEDPAHSEDELPGDAVLDRPSIHQRKQQESAPERPPTQDRSSTKEPKVTLRGIDDMPVSRRRQGPVHGRIMKGSKYIYQQQLGRNMDIGLKGELLVMDYERSRLWSEGKSMKGNLQHASVEIGDGLGYDIISVQDGRKICIEVKTTIGDFWSGLYFSENEFRTMEKMGEDYFLYRLFNLNEDENTADLIIYAGKEMIRGCQEFCVIQKTGGELHNGNTKRDIG